jgi:GNAT superfamily N-acetyltransferase
MLEIKNLDAKTMADGFCTEPSPEGLEWFKKAGSTESDYEEALAERRRFLSDRLAQGAVWGKIAYKEGKPAGWIDCFPSDLKDWVVIGCIIVNAGFTGQGIGRALMEAVVNEAKKRGARGVMVGATIWEHMPKGFFAKCSFIDTDEKADISRMVLKLGKADDPQFPPKENRYQPQLVKGKVVIDLIRTGNCPSPYLTHYLVKKAAEGFKDKVVVTEYATSEKEVVERFGKGGCGIYFNGEPSFFGYPGELENIVAYLQEKIVEVVNNDSSEER